MIDFIKKYSRNLWLLGWLFLVAFLYGLGFYHIQEKLESVREDLALAKQNNKELVRELLLTEISHDQGLIVGLRDYVYNSTIVGSGQFNSNNPVEHFIKLRHSEARMLCGGMSQAYVWMLSFFDIPARTAQLATRKFVEGGKRNDTHVTVEVYDKDAAKWYVSDPTFNISLTCKGEEIFADLEELRECVTADKGISYVNNGLKYIKGKNSWGILFAI